MGNVAFLIAFVALPVASFALVRSLTWITVGVGAAIALVGAFVDFTINRGVRWDFVSLQFALLIALLAVFVASVLANRRSMPRPDVPFARQMTSVIAPVLIGFGFVVLSRLLAAPAAGAFTGVGFLVMRQHAEDNAKWLDFAAQLVAGAPIVQPVPMGGPLQLLVVLAATLLAGVSLMAFGGINEVFVAANSVIYLQFALAMLVPLALAPLAEARVRVVSGSRKRGFIPASALWVASLVMIAASLAVSGLGHLTLQFVFLVLGLWASLFLVGSKIPHAYLLTSLSAAIASLVWFPLTFITLAILFCSLAYFIVSAVRARSLSAVPWLPLGLVVAVVVMMWSSLASVLRYMSDIPEASGAAGSGGGGVHAAVAASPIPTLQLLTSQGGTEIIQPALGLLALASAVLGALFVARQRTGLGGIAKVTPFVPLILIVGFALALSVFGTWFAGAGPAYGALKSTFAASIIVLAVTLPLAIMEIDRRRAGLTAVRVLAIVGVIYILTVDSILPRAITYVSPQQWPAKTAAEGGYWWPAEVRNTADQSIARNPIGCLYLPPGAEEPSGLPDGQLTYSCTRILAGLSGEDAGAQQLVDLLRREWLTNTPAWTAPWGDMVKMSPEVMDKKVILLDNPTDNNVVGLETIRTLLDRYRPQWAEGQPLLTAHP